MICFSLFSFRYALLLDARITWPDLNDQVSVRAANRCDFLNCSQVWIVGFEPIFSKVVVVPKLSKTQLFVGNQIKPFEALKMDVASAMAPIGLGCFTVEDPS